MMNSTAIRVRDRSGKPAGLIARRTDEATGRGLEVNSPTARIPGEAQPSQRKSADTPKQPPINHVQLPDGI